MSQAAKSDNIKVIVRCRPLNGKEVSEHAHNIIETDKTSIKIQRPDKGGKAQSPKVYTFDHAFGPSSSQEEIFVDIVQPLITGVLTGYNGCIFAYGQTGSGKTYTMSGVPDKPGIIPSLVTELFDAVNTHEDPSRFLITVSYLEIYREQIKDLLNPSDKNLDIHEHRELGIYVEGLAELQVKSAAQVGLLLRQGSELRRVASTKMNAESSRSHAVFTIRVQQRWTEVDGDVERKVTLSSRVNLVDLAGSERISKTGATGERLKEGMAINTSLSYLGQVIKALSDPKTKDGYIPYRYSKLTRLLQESLGGNSRTLMVANVSPSHLNFQETTSTLNFAQRAKQIQNKAKRNEDQSSRIISDLRAEIDRLRTLLEGSTTEGPGGDDEGHAEQMKSVVAALEQAKKQVWEGREVESRRFDAERIANLKEAGMAAEVLRWVKEEQSKTSKALVSLAQEKAALREEFMALKQSNSKLKRQGKALGSQMDRIKDKLKGERLKSDQIASHPSYLSLSSEQKLVRRSLSEGVDRQRQIKERLATLTAKIQARQADMTATAAFMQGDEGFRREVRARERDRLRAENARFLAGEREKLREELAAEQGPTLPLAEVIEREMELIAAQADVHQLRKHEKELLKRTAALEDALSAAQRRIDLERQLHSLELQRMQKHALSRERSLKIQLTSALSACSRDAVELAEVNRLLTEQVRSFGQPGVSPPSLM